CGESQNIQDPALSLMRARKLGNLRVYGIESGGILMRFVNCRYNAGSTQWLEAIFKSGPAFHRWNSSNWAAAPGPHHSQIKFKQIKGAFINKHPYAI
ncbi:hypothetical protein HAX54_016981, partial [Datura stramonium]|nr:hypothetical protein [Datura stramonium]